MSIEGLTMQLPPLQVLRYLNVKEPNGESQQGNNWPVAKMPGAFWGGED